MAPSLLSATMSPFSPLLVRDLSSDVNGVKSTFSSWDACMQKDYCKWPVIVCIIIGSLIALSITLCIVRCCCCGMECCCAACSCINACCPSPRGGRRDRTKYRDATPPPMSYQGYQPTPAPFYAQPAPAPFHAQPAAPQFATFDASRKVNADSLPAMPSWDTAATKKVIDEDDHPEADMSKPEQHEEMEPMLPQTASPRPGQAIPVSHQDNAYGYDQGYRTPGSQRPGMPPAQNSYASSAPSSQSYGPGPQQQNFNTGAYGQQRYPRPQNNGSLQNIGQPRYGSPSPSSSNFAAYNNDQRQHNQGGYGASPAQQGYNRNYGSPSGQSMGVTPRAPQPTYSGQQEYSRPSTDVPAALAVGSGYRGSPANAQQTYQPYDSHQYRSQGQNQAWRDV